MLAINDFDFGDFVIWSLWVFVLIMFLWILIGVWTDIFSRHDIHWFAKTLWLIFTIVAPFLGLFIYLISQGRGMTERGMERAQVQRKQAQAYLGTSSAADEIEKLAKLRDAGTITAEEYETMKAGVIT